MIKFLRQFGLYLVCLLVFDRCAYNDLNELQTNVDCTASTLSVTLSSTQDASTCRSIDGKLTVFAAGGEAPYDFSVNGGSYQTGNEFSNLAPGAYTVAVKDKNNCIKTLDVIIDAANSTLAVSYQATGDTQCASHNGSVTVTASGGQAPYLFQINAQGFGATNIFSALKSGQHLVIVKDAADCQRVVSVLVPRNSTGTSYSAMIKSILQENCTSSGCHGTNSGNGDWTNYTKVKEKASLIKTRTSNKSMPIGGNSLTLQQIDLIGCWVDDGAIDN
jgi:hypothetical protein